MKTSESTAAIDNLLGFMDGRNQYLTFLLGDEEYGTDILGVQEITSRDAITRIPKTPPHIKGVMNLRGVIIPVVDLRERFRIAPRKVHEVNVIVILNVRAEDQDRSVGVIVDDVSDVYNLPPETIKPSPDFGTAISTEFIRGIATLKDRIVIIVDADRLFSLEELNAMDELEIED